MLRWAWAIALITLFHTPTAWAASESYPDAFARGEAARKSGNFAEAETALTEALKAKPDSAEALNMLALVQAYQHKYSDAQQTIDRASALAPNDDDVRLSSARIAAWTGKFDEAEQKLAPVIRAHPGDSDALALQGRIAFYQNKPDAARAAFQQALANDPNNVDAILGLGDVARGRGDKAEAESYYTKAQRLAPASKDVADRLEHREPATLAWRLDGSATHSWLSRTPLADWSEQSLALQRRFGSATFGSVGVFRARRFGKEDIQISAGVVTPLAKGVSGALEVGVTPNDDFLPAWRVTPSVNINITDRTIVLIESNFRHYGTGTVKSANLGVQQYFCDGRFDLTARFISSFDSTNHYVSGWSVAAGLTPIDRVHLRASYADAPESEAGIVAGTRTWAAGVSFDVTPTVALRLDYSHEDRERAYIREDLTGGFAVRF